MEYVDIFSKKTDAELLAHTGINDNPIDLEESKQPSYGPINSLKPVELKILKNYIKDNLKNTSIRPLKSLIRASILFIKKANGPLWLCVDYQKLNNLRIKNWYSTVDWRIVELPRSSQAFHPTRSD